MKLPLLARKGNWLVDTRLPSHLPDGLYLPELAPSTDCVGLPRLHRAGPSASLDKSAVRGYGIVGRMIPQAGKNVNCAHLIWPGRMPCGRTDFRACIDGLERPSYVGLTAGSGHLARER